MVGAVEPNDDDVIDIKMPRRDYKIMREMIEERQAMRGLKRWISGKLLFVIGSLLAVTGLLEALKRLGA